MKRIISPLIFILMLFALTSCGGKEKLLFLNWGEYIDDTMISAFEDKYNCIVLMDLSESNENFYSKVRTGTTVYDVVCPSDYMVEKMYRNDMLAEIDFSKIKSYSKNEGLKKGVQKIMTQMQEDCDEDITNYFVPYLWGTWGIMYSTEKEGLEEVVTNSSNEWECLFNREALPDGTRIAMYDSHQHAYYAACQYLGDAFPYNEELPQSKLNKIKALIKNVSYDAWGADNIKKDIVAGNLDLGFMWTGDFLYYYCEEAASTVMEAYLNKDIDYTEFKAMLDTILSDERIYRTNNKQYSIGFDLYIPESTIAFCDNLVITKDASNKDLAHKFIDFMSSYNEAYIKNEVEVNVSPSYSNAYYVCYDTPFISVYNDIVSLSNTDFNSDSIEGFDNSSNPYDSDLYWSFYDYAIGIAFTKYYSLDLAKGSILPSFDRSYIDIINTTLNNARV